MAKANTRSECRGRRKACKSPKLGRSWSVVREIWPGFAPGRLFCQAH